ncbi:MAG: SDR family oxidoreductase [Proteobacteria bacterium]|jgi:3-oxoacyl-[acyl-carrier protein] reductase|nr:SDR family oxidoreductase [Pseudomonadota bacterium]NLN62921.1 SDR family oxidoreductase [Myxococcales bacterium]
MKRLEGKVAIITGAAAGIGEVTAKLFAEEGAKVVCCDVTADKLEQVVADIRAAGGEAIAVTCNVANEAEVKAMVETTVQTFGKLHILINNAGITRDSLTPRLTEEAWDLVMDINLKGHFLCAKWALRKMEKGGKIVNTASISTLGNVGQANYSASKMGVIGLTRTQALEYARKKICINAIAPGAIDTPMLAAVSDQARQAMLDKIPLGEYIPPIEIARAHLFLASDEANFITGQTLFVDGGMSVGM